VGKYGVLIRGPLNLPATMPIDASQMYSRNVTNLLRHLYETESGSLDFEDEITRSACITREGEVFNESVRAALQEEGLQV
jgi:NAD(P) transhydrogenase subunit alpha